MKQTQLSLVNDSKEQTTKAGEKKMPEISEEQKQAVRDMLTAQMVGREYAPVSHDTLSKSITYVTAGNGLFKVRKTPIAVFKEQIAEIKEENTGLPDMEEGVELAIPKLPFKYLIEILSFYRDVNNKDKAEASVLFFYNHKDVALPDIPGIREQDRIITYVPEQVNSATLSDFEDDDWVHWFRENTALLLETHSHNSMGAFFSGTDDANENNNQFYAVWGKVDKDIPQMAFRYVNGKEKVEVDPTILFEWPTVKQKVTKVTQIEETVVGDVSMLEGDFEEGTYVETPEVEEYEVYIEGPFKQIEYPKDWMPQHSKSVPKYGNYANGYYGGYYGGYNSGKAKKGKSVGGSKKKSTTSRTTYGSEDIYNNYYGYGDDFYFDELSTLSIHPNGSRIDVISPSLDLVIHEYLEDIRETYLATYQKFAD